MTPGHAFAGHRAQCGERWIMQPAPEGQQGCLLSLVDEHRHGRALGEERPEPHVGLGGENAGNGIDEELIGEVPVVCRRGTVDDQGIVRAQEGARLPRVDGDDVHPEQASLPDRPAQRGQRARRAVDAHDE
ncbi:hypothetical protein OHA47_08575 [Streptomyces sp. NBC_00498]